MKESFLFVLSIIDENRVFRVRNAFPGDARQAVRSALDGNLIFEYL